MSKLKNKLFIINNRLNQNDDLESDLICVNLKDLVEMRVERNGKNIIL